MSKDQKKTVKIDVEIVDKWWKNLTYVVTTIRFWGKNEEWPINLCTDVLDEIKNEIYKTKIN